MNNKNKIFLKSEQTNYHLTVLLLAAGKSKRFGGIKQLAPLNNRHPNDPNASLTLIEHTLNNIKQALGLFSINTENIYIATGQYHQKISALLPKEASLLYCSESNLGLGHTIAQAVKYISEQSKNTSHLMITLADQIALESDDYGQLIKQSILFPKKIPCAKAKKCFMAPAIFPSSYFSQLTLLSADKGARSILMKNIDQLQPVSLPKAIIDIDTQQDLAQWQSQFANNTSSIS